MAILFPFDDLRFDTPNIPLTVALNIVHGLHVRDLMTVNSVFTAIRDDFSLVQTLFYLF